jgi:hypothetical protein
MTPHGLVLFMDVFRPFSYLAGLLNRMTIPAISASPKVGIWPLLKLPPQASTDLKANLFMDVSQPFLTLLAWSNRRNTQAIAASPTHSRSAKELPAILDLCT